MKIKESLHVLLGNWRAAAFVVVLMIAGMLASCSEDSNTTVDEFPNWQAANDTYWDNLYAATQAKIAAGDTSWKMLLNYSYQNQTPGKSGTTLTYGKDKYVIVHVEQSGTATESPLFTDSVLVHYQGRLIPSTTYTSGLIFDSSWGSETFNAQTARPAQLLLSSTVPGFATAIMQMHKGDHWTVYIPYQLAYGSSTTGTVPAYSNLIFDLRLGNSYHAGTPVPDVQ